MGWKTPRCGKNIVGGGPRGRQIWAKTSWKEKPRGKVPKVEIGVDTTGSEKIYWEKDFWEEKLKRRKNQRWRTHIGRRYTGIKKTKRNILRENGVGRRSRTVFTVTYWQGRLCLMIFLTGSLLKRWRGLAAGWFSLCGLCPSCFLYAGNTPVVTEIAH